MAGEWGTVTLDSLIEPNRGISYGIVQPGVPVADGVPIVRVSDVLTDVVVHLADKNWLVLIEAVTSHGPIGLKRHNELEGIFGTARSGLVFVTAFLTRRAMTKYLGEIAWETEVWIADAPSHIIHFNGERFLGPYE